MLYHAAEGRIIQYTRHRKIHFHLGKQTTNRVRRETSNRCIRDLQGGKTII